LAAHFSSKTQSISPVAISIFPDFSRKQREAENHCLSPIKGRCRSLQKYTARIGSLSESCKGQGQFAESYCVDIFFEKEDC
jgi:hypothetical protein